MSESDTHLEGYPCDWFFFDFKLKDRAVLLCFILKDQLKYELFIHSQWSKEKKINFEKMFVFWGSILHTFFVKVNLEN